MLIAIKKIIAPTSNHHKTRQRDNNIHTMHATAMRKSTKLCSTQKQNLQHPSISTTHTFHTAFTLHTLHTTFQPAKFPHATLMILKT